MPEKQNGKIDFTVHPACVEYDRTKDVLTEISVGKVDDDHPYRYIRWEIVTKLPDMKPMLSTPEGQAFLKELDEQWGLDAQGVRDRLGKALSVLPNYHDLLGDNKMPADDFQHQAQELNDNYRLGAKKPSKTKETRAKASAMDDIAGMLPEDINPNDMAAVTAYIRSKLQS